MTVTAKALINSQFASSAGGILYTAPPNTTTIIDKFTATNIDSGGAHTLSVYIVPAGSTFGNSNLIATVFSIAASTLKDFTELQNQILNPGDEIYALASSASDIVVRASGREVT